MLGILGLLGCQCSGALHPRVIREPLKRCIMYPIVKLDYVVLCTLALAGSLCGFVLCTLELLGSLYSVVLCTQELGSLFILVLYTPELLVGSSFAMFYALYGAFAVLFYVSKSLQ